nr:anaerobic ribonucleoside-triphosphate reductase [Litorihabitans aurantiacus]
MRLHRRVHPDGEGFACPACGNGDPRTCDVVKRTCGYLGNPQQRPMVHGRHVEISSRAKHLADGVTADDAADVDDPARARP